MRRNGGAVGANGAQGAVQGSRRGFAGTGLARGGIDPFQAARSADIVQPRRRAGSALRGERREPVQHEGERRRPCGKLAGNATARAKHARQSSAHREAPSILRCGKLPHANGAGSHARSLPNKNYRKFNPVAILPRLAGAPGTGIPTHVVLARAANPDLVAAARQGRPHPQRNRQVEQGRGSGRAQQLMHAPHGFQKFRRRAE